jgi:transcriptional regulator with XRE-family HTH domain
VLYARKPDHSYMVNAVGFDKKKAPELVLFGESVRRYRKERGYSQEAFGDACGIDRSYMGGIERGEHNLALLNILKIVAALGMQPSEFFRAMDRPGRRPKKSLASTRSPAKPRDVGRGA